MRAALVAALALAALGGCGGGDDEKDSSRGSAKSTEERRETLERLGARQVAERVQELRGLDYEPFPKLKGVTREQSAAYVADQAGDVRQRGRG